MASLLLQGPKVMACLAIPAYAGVIGASIGGFLLCAVAIGFGVTLGEWIVENFGHIEMTEIATCVGFWFGLALNFGFPAFGIGRLVSYLI